MVGNEPCSAVFNRIDVRLAKSKSRFRIFISQATKKGESLQIFLAILTPKNYTKILNLKASHAFCENFKKGFMHQP
jgi:hypothetical protein